jgi:hypothetical protein
MSVVNISETTAKFAIFPRARNTYYSHGAVTPKERNVLKHCVTFQVLKMVTMKNIFCDVKPYNLVEVNQRSGTLKMRETYTFKISVNVYQTTRRHIPKCSIIL